MKKAPAPAIATPPPVDTEDVANTAAINALPDSELAALAGEMPSAHDSARGNATQKDKEAADDGAVARGMEAGVDNVGALRAAALASSPSALGAPPSEPAGELEATQRMDEDDDLAPPADADDQVEAAQPPALSRTAPQEGEPQPAPPTSPFDGSAEEPSRGKTPATPAMRPPAQARRGFNAPVAKRGFAPPTAAPAAAGGAAPSIGAPVGKDGDDEQLSRVRKGGPAKPRKPREPKAGGSAGKGKKRGRGDDDDDEARAPSDTDAMAEDDEYDAVLEARRAEKRARKEAKAAAKAAAKAPAKKPSAAARRAEREASGEPKKPKSAFMFFSQAQSAAAARDGGAKLSMPERAKVTGAAWRALDEAGKRPFEALAAAEKARYAEAKAAFDKTRPAGTKTFATPSPKKAPAKAKAGGSAAVAKPRRLVAARAVAAVAPPPAEEDRACVQPKDEHWILPVTFAAGDQVVWFPRALAELCSEQAHTKHLQTSGLLAGATRLAERADSEVHARVVRVEPPAPRNVVWTLALAATGDGGVEYALPYIPAPDCEVAQHILLLSAHEAFAGKFKENDHIAVPFAVPGGERRADGAVPGELWEGRIYDIDESCGAFESLSVIWYEQVASTGRWFMSGVQNDTSVSPHDCMPSERHALWTANNGGAAPPGRRVVYGKAPGLKTTVVDDLDIAPKDDSLGEFARVALLRLSTLESSEPFLCPVPRADEGYHAIVSSPICLHEMEAKRAAGEYRALEQLKRDVDTLINNAFIGNGEDMLAFHQARELNKEWVRIQAELAPPASPPDVEMADAQAAA